MADIQQIWENFKKNQHNAKEYMEFLARNKEELLLLPAIKSDIFNNYAITLINESSISDAEKILQAYEALKSHLRLFLRDQDCSLKEKQVFSFRSCTPYAIEDIKNKTCSLVHPSLFNDPIDPLIQNWLHAKIAQRTINPAKLEYYSLLLRAISHLRMRCFVTAKNDDIRNINPLMWAHYANSHSGFCIKYKLNASLIQEYNNDLCSLTYHPILYRMPTELKKISLHDALYAKKVIWKYEKEIRFVAYDMELQDIHTPKLIQNMVAEALYIGCRCSEEDEIKLIDATHGTTIPILKMEVDEFNPTNFVYKRIL